MEFPPRVDVVFVFRTSVRVGHRHQLLLRSLFEAVTVPSDRAPPGVPVFGPEGEHPPVTGRGCPHTCDGGPVLQLRFSSPIGVSFVIEIY